MSINPPLTDLPIEKANNGFYQGFNRAVTIGSKTLIGALILWAAVFSDQAGALLTKFNGFLLAHFGHWYMYVVAFYVVVCFILALWPRTGSIHLGQLNEKPEFSRFSWFSMMFGAGIGIGMLTYATAEPIYHFSNNPDVIRGTVTAVTAGNVRPAFQWSFLH
jgi:choline-glycine betaine transporter